MATTTYLNGTVTAGATQVTLAAFTNPSTGAIGPNTILQFATGERCLVTDATLSPTLSVVRGYSGTLAAAHNVYEGVSYGLANDTSFTVGGPVMVQNFVATEAAQEITATGATGSTAAVVIAQPPAFLSATGASGAGINLPVPAVGWRYTVKNNMTGALNVYCVGGSINGTTGTTASAITATGDLGTIFWCATAGQWRSAPNAT